MPNSDSSESIETVQQHQRMESAFIEKETILLVNTNEGNAAASKLSASNPREENESLNDPTVVNSSANATTADGGQPTEQ